MSESARSSAPDAAEAAASDPVPAKEPVEEFESTEHPVVALLPYLGLAEPLHFGGWWLGALDDYSGAWDSDELREATFRLSQLFLGPLGSPVDRPSLLALQDGGVDGRMPSRSIRVALTTAVGFAVIDRNPYWDPAVQHDGWKINTSDNTDIWFQPLNRDNEGIAIGTGSRVRTTHGGGTLDGPAIQSPLELNLPAQTRLDEELLAATYDTLAGLTTCDDRDRLAVAIRWLMKAWANSASISDEDRVIFLKVALEALAGTHWSRDAAEHFVVMFALAQEQTGGPIGLEDLLWSPAESTITRWRISRSGAEKSEDLTLFEHWFMALADARNEIVHAGSAASLQYAEAGSPYEGPLLEIADRVVREGIKVMLGRCGFPAVWRSPLARASMRATERLFGSADDHDAGTEEDPDD